MPLVIATGAGAESRIAIGIVIIGGLGIASLLTLFVTPVLYDLLARFAKPTREVSDQIERELGDRGNDAGIEPAGRVSGTLLLYLSHPEVVIDPEMPVPEWRLSRTGRKRILAARNAPWLSACQRIVTSGETKAVETAALIAGATGALIEVREAMHENDREATGFLPPAEFETVADAFFANPRQSVRGWERAIDAQARILAELEAIMAAQSTAEQLLLVGHGGVGTLLYCALAGHADRPPIRPAPSRQCLRHRQHDTPTALRLDTIGGRAALGPRRRLRDAAGRPNGKPMRPGNRAGRGRCGLSRQ